MFGALMGVLGLAGSGLSAFGTYAGGMAQRRAREYNASIMEQRAQMVQQAKESETDLMRDRARRLKATQFVQFAKSGALPTTGTPLTVMAEQAAEMEKDILQQRRTRDIQAMQLGQAAEMERIRGKQASRAGILGAAGTLLGGAGKAGMIFGGGSGGSGIPSGGMSPQQYTSMTGFSPSSALQYGSLF